MPECYVMLYGYLYNASHGRLFRGARKQQMCSTKAIRLAVAVALLAAFTHANGNLFDLILLFDRHKRSTFVLNKFKYVTLHAPTALVELTRLGCYSRK